MTNNILIVGLGNPGTKYQHTRHNAGFMALDAFAKEHGFPEFHPSKKHNALVSKGFLKEKTAILAKPLAFMNNSGSAVKSILKNSPFENLFVVHDDIDIPLGKVKISKARGSAGHKGVESIIRELGNKDFIRIRIGIQPPEGKPANVEDFVLKNFSPVERTLLTSTLRETTALLESLLAKR